MLKLKDINVYETCKNVAFISFLSYYNIKKLVFERFLCLKIIKTLTK